MGAGGGVPAQQSEQPVPRLDPETLEAELVLSERDHIGGIVHNVHGGTLQGVSWGSRRWYTWKLRGDAHAERVGASDWVPNPQFYIDYQDCHSHGVEYMLCGGVCGYATPRGSVAFGGLDLVDLRRNRLEHQVPVNLFIDEGAGATGDLALTHNAFWLEPLGDGSLRG